MASKARPKTLRRFNTTDSESWRHDAPDGFVSIRPVLLVDDDPHDRELAIDALRAWYLANPIVALDDGAEALTYLTRARHYNVTSSSAQPAVVLLDTDMPRMSGIEVLRAMREDPRLAPLPVIMMVASRDSAASAEAWDLDVAAVIVKPIDGAQLFAAVRTVGVEWAVVDPPQTNVQHSPHVT